MWFLDKKRDKKCIVIKRMASDGQVVIWPVTGQKVGFDRSGPLLVKCTLKSEVAKRRFFCDYGVRGKLFHYEKNVFKNGLIIVS